MHRLTYADGHEGRPATGHAAPARAYALLTRPGRLARTRDDPSVAETGVEEPLRFLSIIHIGPIRTAVEDVEIDGHTVRAGETVTVHPPVADRDPARFPGGGHLDLTRPATGHLAFGHGVHQCLGQQPARVELRIALPALLRRFPGLRLAVPPEQVRMREDMSVYGVHALPVAW